MEKLLIRTGQKILFLAENDVDFIEADRNYVRIHFGEKSYVIRQTLSNMEKKLTSGSFIRINRSVIVNVNRVREILVNRSSTYEIVLNNEKKWTLGRRFRQNLNLFIQKQTKV